jgi:hypothetical protein
MVGLKAPGIRQLRHVEQVDLVRHDQGGYGLRATVAEKSALNYVLMTTAPGTVPQSA